jgi:hypothetical protein
VFENLTGEAIMVKRPDLGNNRYVEILSAQGIGRYESGRLVFKDLILPDKAIKTIEGVLGYPGQWK